MDVNSCQDSFVVVVVENLLLDINLQGLVIFCEGDSIILFVVFVEYFFVIWLMGSEEVDVIIMVFGLYQVFVLDLNGCICDFIFIVEELALLVIEIIGLDFVCVMDSVMLQVMLGLMDYIWFFGVGGFEIIVDSIVIYLVIVIGDNGCLNIVIFDFEVIDLLEVVLFDLVWYCEDGVVVIGVFVGVGLVYEWVFGEMVLEIEVDVFGIYILIVIIFEGCII